MRVQSAKNTGMSLVEIVLVMAVASVYITSGFAWFATLENASTTDRLTFERYVRAGEILSAYTTYEDVLSATSTSIISNESSVIENVTLFDLDRITRKVSVEVKGISSGPSIRLERIFSDHSIHHIDPWCGKLAVDEEDTLIQTDELPVSNSFFTDVAPMGRYIVVSADSSTVSNPDLYVFDTDPYLNEISMLHTGPGLAAVVTSGKTAFVANTSASSQLQVLSLMDPLHPTIIGSYASALPTPTTTPPRASAISYSDKRVYLGFEKWNGEELHVIDVSDPSHPQKLYGIELGSMIQDIATDGDEVYIALSSTPQFVGYKGTDNFWSFSPPGSNVQEGKRITLLASHLVLGRTVGGFNVAANHELFVINRESMDLSTSTDIGSGVYGLVVSTNKIVAAISGVTSYLGLITDFKKSFIPSFKHILSSAPKNIVCTGDDVFVVTPHSIIRF